MTFNLASFSFVLASTMVIAACGSDGPLDPGAGNDPGGGTGTLYVEGSARAEPRVANSTKATDFTTEFSIRLGLNGAAVTTGTVTMQSRSAMTELVFESTTDNLGRWTGTAANYDEVYQLDVVSGDDNIHAVIVDGPDIHEFTTPTAGASLDPAVANDIEWDRAEEADVTTFRAEEQDRITIPDSGTYSMPPDAMKAEKDKTVTNRLELQRENSVVPAGAVPGSELSVSVMQEIDVVALANPAL